MHLVDSLPMIFVSAVFIGMVGYLILEFAKAKKAQFGLNKLFFLRLIVKQLLGGFSDAKFRTGDRG